MDLDYLLHTPMRDDWRLWLGTGLGVLGILGAMLTRGYPPARRWFWLSTGGWAVGGLLLVWTTL